MEMTNAEFELAMKEFTDNGGKVEQLEYHGPRFVEKTFPRRGYLWATGATTARLKDEGIGK